MFSTNDRVSLRQLRAYAIDDGEDHLLRLPATLGSHARAIRSVPAEQHLLDFAQRLARYESQKSADAIRVEVWRTRFDSATRTASLVKVREATYTRPE